MPEVQDQQTTRLLFILHRGFVESRALALAKRDQQLAELADIMEVVPGYIHCPDEEDLEIIRLGLQKYQDKYPSHLFDYVGYLSGDEPVHWNAADRSETDKA